MHRFFLLDTELVRGETVDLAPVAHQLFRVLRLKPGDQISLLDNAGFEYVTTIEKLGPHETVGLVLSCRPATGEPSAHLTLYQCSLKADKFEWVLQKGTELGVCAFVPVISHRSVVRPADALRKKYDRWRTIIREAAEQSRRGRLPLLREPLSFSAAIAEPAGLRLLPWEERALEPTAPMLGAAIARHWDGYQSVSLMVGPEGGLSADEVRAAEAAHWHVVSLGPRVLRAETAAIASVATAVDRTYPQ